MLSCLICSESLFSTKSDQNVFVSRAKSQIKWRKKIFPLFCQLLGIPIDKTEAFVKEYDFETEFPCCQNCIHLPAILSTYSECRDTLEKEILALQISICDKLRKVTESSKEIDEILRQVRYSVGLKSGRRCRDPGRVDFRREKFRKLILQSTPKKDKNTSGKILEPMAIQMSMKSSSRATMETFRTTITPEYPEPVEVIVSNIKTEEDLTDVLTDRSDWSNDASKNIANDEDRVHLSTMEDFVFTKYELASENYEIENDGIDIQLDPLCIPPENEVESDYFNPTVSKIQESAATSDIVPTSSETSHNRKRYHSEIIKRTIYAKSDDESSSNEEEDANNDSDWLEEGAGKVESGKNISKKVNQTQSEVSVLSYHYSNQHKCSEYLGTLKSTHDGHLNFRDVEVIEKPGNIYECGVCGVTYRPPGGRSIDDSVRKANLGIRDHIIRNHLGGYRCTICVKKENLQTKSYQTFILYLQHMRVHKMPAVDCEICGKPFKRNGNGLKSHLYSHKNQEEKDAAIRSGIKPPRDRKEERLKRSTNHECPTCNKCFIEKHDFARHLETHRDPVERQKEKVPCNICGRKYHPHTIKFHVKNAHNGPAPFKHKCMECDKRFTSLGLLNAHVRNVHLREKSYTCGVCGEIFGDRKALSMHRVIHSERNAFACTLCSTKCVHQESLTKHMKNIHGIFDLAATF